MELMQYWNVVRKSLWIVLLICAFGLGATALYTINQRPEYVSSTTLLLNPSVPSSLVPYVQVQVAANLADSYTKVIHTRSFGESVAKELSYEASSEQVIDAISAKLVPNTLFYEITAKQNTPEQSQELLTAVLKVFLAADSQRLASSQGTDTVKDEMRQNLQTELKYFDDQIKSYQARIQELEAQPASKERDDQLIQLRGQIVTLHQTKTGTMVALGELGSNSASPNTALVIDQPLLGERVPSNLLRNLLLALAVSLLIGVGIAFLRDYLDNTIHSPEYLESLLGLAPLGAIGVVGDSHGRTFYGYGRQNKQEGSRSTKAPEQLAGRNLITLEHPKSVESESFKVLRTNIQFSSMDKPIRKIVVTSSGPGEGKTFTSCNLAIVMAQAGKRVILVDADLRKPSVHKAFGLPNQVGFTNLLLNHSSQVEGAIQRVPGISDLAIITSGPLPPNPSEILNSHQAAQIMEELAGQADIVIYDSPPAAAVTDAVILATRTDATILVINAGNTRRDIVMRIKQNLEKVGVLAVLPVLNRVKSRDLQGSYYYYSYYGNQDQDSKSDSPGAHTDGKTPTSTDREVIRSSQNSYKG